jgi:hypothetical protein
MSAHTPGPWTMRPDTGLAIFGADGEWLMSVHRPVEELRANACLIAAAPEMAELLQILAGGKVTDRVVMSVEMDRQFKALSRARALLAKLEGKL